MNQVKHILVWDGIGFTGGSKRATLSLLSQLDMSQFRLSVITQDPDSWSAFTEIQRLRFWQPKFLAKQTKGIGFVLKHAFLAVNLVLARLRLGRVDLAIGASGPGVDFCLYIAQWLLGYRIAQLVHGPVACSRMIGRCLRRADSLYYLKSTRSSLEHALERSLPGAGLKLALAHCQVFENGIASQDWPTRCQQKRPQLFWAASLLKWKGLDLFLEALQRLDPATRPPAQICFIRPKQIDLPMSQAPQSIAGITWHEQPDSLDAIRASCNLFVSTSDNEPFGLSILEAMAAGHCILLPKDGAYWDNRLEDGLNCLKYQPNDAASLAERIAYIQGNPRLRISLGQAARDYANRYQAANCYASLIAHLHQLLSLPAPTPVAPTSAQEACS